ncbi:MAG: DEAD/DEAH box helicase [Ilumatobacteraceae bacterium]|nr:DEAD/DEAH box helicase [Ilumatobacteraceae bacterium]
MSEQHSGRGRGGGTRNRRRPAPQRRPETSNEEQRTGRLTTANSLPAVEPPTGFAELGVPARIDIGLAAAGFAEPFAIQIEAIPVAMGGRDVCGRAKTGSGKTLAFGIPMLSRIEGSAGPSAPLGLVLVPTRELAVQVAEVLQPVAAAAGITVAPVYGGASREHQVRELQGGVELVVATPLRLIDLIKSDEVDLGAVQIVCLDEADRMADDGFTPQVEWILRHCTGRSQTMLFSATLDGDVGHLIRHYLKDPVEVAIDSATDTVGSMHHLFLAVHHMDKARIVGAISESISKVVVFCQTKRLCDKVENALVDNGVNAAAIHGDLSQAARERALQRFAEGRLNVLVATDVAARGIDIDDIGAVIHYDPAGDAKDYLHRSGRTARAGRDGWAITFVEYNQHTQMRVLQRMLRLPSNKPIEVFSNDTRLRDLASFNADVTTDAID